MQKVHLKSFVYPFPLPGFTYTGFFFAGLGREGLRVNEAVTFSTGTHVCNKQLSSQVGGISRAPMVSHGLNDTLITNAALCQ